MGFISTKQSVKYIVNILYLNSKILFCFVFFQSTKKKKKKLCMTLNIPGIEAVESALWSSFILSRATISWVFQRTRSIYLIKDRMDLDCCPVRGFLVGLGRPEKRAPSFEIDRQFNQQLNNCHEWLYLSPIIKYPNSYVHLLFHGRPWTGHCFRPWK